MHITPDGKRICLANTSSNLNSDLYYLLSIDPYEINEHDTFTVQENGTQAAGIPGLFFNEDVQIEEPAPSTIFVELAAVNDSINPEDSVSIGSILVSGVVGEDISITDARGTNQINPAPIYIYRTSGGISRQKNTHTGHIIPEGLKRAPSPKDTSSQKRGGTL
jgi:hypothetical protein